MHAQTEIELGGVDIRLLVVKEAALALTRRHSMSGTGSRRTSSSGVSGAPIRSAIVRQKLFLLVQALHLPDAKPDEHQEGRHGPKRHTGKRPETDHEAGINNLMALPAIGGRGPTAPAPIGRARGPI